MCHMRYLQSFLFELHTSLNNGPIVICTIRLLSKWYFYSQLPKFSRLDKSDSEFKSGEILYSWKNLLRNIGILKWISVFKPFRFVSHPSWTWTMETRVTARSQSAVWWERGCQPTLITDQQWVTSTAPNSTDNCSYYYTSPSHIDRERQPNCQRGREAWDKHASCSTEAQHQSF